ncbi:afg3-like protein 2 [Stylonychia lemnae]|uniref:Afg3-like protein 2 n=1 Tax=Stylonychia lemnae TaxID=5949 RepID=A0A078B2W6_STYLE|nr:afg3-like protein 2 [Stylonychia lemnae]|eukprot:CDW88581.1 afg3-like protein 2 [Stylonychia lemnae]
MQRLFLQKVSSTTAQQRLKSLTVLDKIVPTASRQITTNTQPSQSPRKSDVIAVPIDSSIESSMNLSSQPSSLENRVNRMLRYLPSIRGENSFIKQQMDYFTFKMQKNEGDKEEKQPLTPPKGFEKFFKKKEDEKKAAQKSDDPKTENKEAKKPQEEQISDEEEPDTKDKNKEKKSSEYDATSFKNSLNNFFFQPNGGGPIIENWVVALLLSGAFYYYLTSKSPSQEITYMDFINQYLTKNQVKMITITEDKTSDMFKYKAEIELLEGKKVHLVLPQVENFLYKLDLAQREMGKMPNDFVPVKYASEASQSQNNTMLNFFIGGLFIVFLMQIYRSMHGKGGPGASGGQNASKGGNQPGKGPFGGGGSGGMNDIFGMGKSNVQIYGVDKKIKTKFKHVAGMEGAKQEVQEFVDFLKDPKKYQKLGAQIPRGALLVGPPGTGKTLLAKAVAGEAGVPFLSISGSDFVEMFVGVGASRVRDLFKKAREKAPSIIFIDEIDAVAKKRQGKFGGNDERDNTLNQLLVEMDGFGTEESVIVLAATNRADILDAAVLRPGRFDRQIEITLPTIKDRTEIFKVHLKKIKLNAEKSREEYAKKMASLTPGFSGAEISNVVNEGAIIAARKDAESVGIQEFESAIERVIGGLERKTIITKDEKKIIAYHEAGHAVAGWFLEHSNPLLKVTIIPRSKGALGFAQYLPEEISLYSKEALQDMICTALGGRIAEDLFFGKITTGASDDIKKVTQIAQGLVTVYGMTDRIGLVGYSSEEQSIKPYSDSTNEIIDEEVRRIVMECYNSTKELLESKKDLIHDLAEELLAKETITLPDILRILGDRPYPLKETVREYLEELKERKVKDDEKIQEAANTLAENLEKKAESESEQAATEKKEDSSDSQSAAPIEDKQKDHNETLK